MQILEKKYFNRKKQNFNYSFFFTSIRKFTDMAHVCLYKDLDRTRYSGNLR